MPTHLFEVAVPSIYRVADHPVLLPKRMAQATADMKAAILGLGEALKGAGGRLVLSDLFRSYDMQTQAHMDYVSGRKKAFSPPAGGSFHEAGRAFDLDLNQIHVPLADFWKLAAPFGMVPIISAPNPKTSEAWHFERRGSHQKVHDYYKAGKGKNFKTPYVAAAASAILSIGVRVDAFGDRQAAAYIQSGLIRLGHDIGNIDGVIGKRTRDALKAHGVNTGDIDEATDAVDLALQHAFPEEFFDRTPIAAEMAQT